ncbi:hypothetical protein BU24DRAFT_457940 [Aaosphaeria arxii CBS 175.79]|uniref:Uncharacterized protein n=1 Tax=Aaosphaeria arxii CBS 175.79 TaxID=1450172 RepID=A0A6A5Y8X8_9PLEO|nr:uncharacterized protein BU24DRAFT_457940 [Aaosphaeria arxii CBS 175.79]KAF2022035.1 hypothetical protein BU24DRAFT_457940 [Aaosphaeria arxii CBS 175.79]
MAPLQAEVIAPELSAKIKPAPIAISATIILLVICIGIAFRPTRPMPVFREDITDCCEPYIEQELGAKLANHHYSEKPSFVPPRENRGQGRTAITQWRPSLALNANDSPRQPPETHRQGSHRDSVSTYKHFPYSSSNKSGLSKSSSLMEMDGPALARRDYPSTEQDQIHRLSVGAFLKVPSQASFGRLHERLGGGRRRLDLGSQYEGSFIPRTVSDARVSADPY